MKIKKQVREIIDIITEYLLTYPDKDISEQELLNYIKGKSIRFKEDEFKEAICILDDLEIIKWPSYYRLNEENPIIKFFKNKEKIDN